jgi:cobalt/nickel transport system permease protein
MHIPDGYLGPQTYIPFYGVFIAAIAVAVKKIKKEVPLSNIPYLGMAAAFSFIIMMFNLPVPGGTTGHAVGSALISIIFGPWVAMISVSVALIIQALIFGDGGITAIGANCFNMAVFMPLMAYWIFRLLCGSSHKPWRIMLASFFAGYLSLVLAAVLTGFEFGIQPLIASGADGKPLYCPYDLKIAVPVMALEHILLFGVVEGVVTALIVRFFAKQQNISIYAFSKGKTGE